MSTYYVGSDHCYKDSQHHVDVVSETLRQKGHTVTSVGVGPNKENVCRAHAGEDDSILVFICCGIDGCTEWSIKEAIKSGNGCKTIFAYTGFARKNVPTSSIKDAETCDNYKIGPSGDAKQYLTAKSRSSCIADIAGRTHKQYHQDNSEYIAYCYSDQSIEDLAQKIADGTFFGTSGSSEQSGGGGGAQIKDKTFEDCIKRICAATDSVFMVENNAAVMFPYTDWMAFTLQKKMNTISAKDIDPNIFEVDYTPDGAYNKVTAVWGGNELPDRDFDKKHNKTTKVTKNGKITTKEKNKNDGSVMLSKQYDVLVDMFGELEKRVELKVDDRNTAEYIVNALLIQFVREFNNAYKVRTLNQRKYIGGTFYAVENPFNKNINVLYLNGYSIRTQKNEPLYIDLDFRYGPEGPEDIGDYQQYTGGSSGSGESTDSSGGALGSNAIEVGNALAAKYTYKQHAGSETYGSMKQKGFGSCFAWSGALYTELKAIGYTVRVVQYGTQYSPRHRSVQYKDQSGNWVDYPYRDTKIPKMAWATSGSSGGKVVLDENGNGIAKDILN